MLAAHGNHDQKVRDYEEEDTVLLCQIACWAALVRTAEVLSRGALFLILSALCVSQVMPVPGSRGRGLRKPPFLLQSDAGVVPSQRHSFTSAIPRSSCICSDRCIAISTLVSFGLLLSTHPLELWLPGCTRQMCQTSRDGTGSRKHLTCGEASMGWHKARFWSRISRGLTI